MQEVTGGELLDIFELFGVTDRHELFALSQENYLRCALGLVPQTASMAASAERFRQKLPGGESPVIINSYLSLLAAILATGAIKGRPTMARALAFHQDENLYVPLLQQVDQVLAGSPLTVELAVEQGLDREKIHFVPLQWPEQIPTVKPTQSDRITVGCICRFDYRRNVEFLLRAFEEVHRQIPQAHLLLKGDFDDSGDLAQGEGYTERLKALLATKRPWLTWERERRDSIWPTLASIDLGVYLSGTEEPANIVMEMAAMGKPMLLLETSGRADLWEGMVARTPHAGYSQMRQGAFPFFIPNREALVANLVKWIGDEQGRRELGERARALGRERFGPNIVDRGPISAYIDRSCAR